MNIKLDVDRVQLIKKLPKNGTVAEIGVYRGEFSEKILEYSNPKQLILIDPWKTMLDADSIDPNFESFYNEVLGKFKENTNVEVVRKTSLDAAKDIENGSLDWVYIDGDHNYKPCLEDLRAYASKIKDDGYICGHDWIVKPKSGFGVNEAVKKFLEETDFTLVGLTNENNFKSYVIAKIKEGEKRFNEK